MTTMGTRRLLAAALLAAAVAAPAAAAPAPVSEPFMWVELRMDPFKGADAAETRRRAEAFLAQTGLKIRSYQDNEAVSAVTLSLPTPPDGALAHIHARIQRMKVISALRATRKVSEVVEYANSDEIGVRFSPAPYREEASRLLSAVPSGTTVTYFLNPRMHGLWVSLDVTGVADPRAAARDFAARHPAEVESADIRVEVEVLKVETGAAGR